MERERGRYRGSREGTEGGKESIEGRRKVKREGGR